jgi:isopentenyl phosphate kinase
MKDLVFLKLGGSLITDKNTPHHARLDIINRLASEIAVGLHDNPSLRLLIGHGSGSFGHVPAKKYHTRDGVSTTEGWRGFAEVWQEAKALNTIVMEALIGTGLPAIAFSPCAQVLTRSHNIIEWNTTQIFRSLKNDLVPVIYGDVVFDSVVGGTILSTEEQFEYLAGIFKPARILLAGIEPGVWKSFPERDDFYPTISPSNLEDVDTHLAASESTDVTGGMRSKVHSMMNLVLARNCNEISIFSGLEPGSVYNVLSGKCNGTRITQD